MSNSLYYNSVALGVGCLAAVMSFAYTNFHGVCDEGAFIASTVGAVSTVVSAVAYSVLAVCARKEALPVRLFTVAAAFMVWSAAAMYVASDVIMGQCAFGDSGSNVGGVDSFKTAIKLQTISICISSVVMGLFSIGIFCYTEIAASFNGRRRSRPYKETSV